MKLPSKPAKPKPPTMPDEFMEYKFSRHIYDFDGVQWSKLPEKFLSYYKIITYGIFKHL